MTDIVFDKDSIKKRLNDLEAEKKTLEGGLNFMQQQFNQTQTKLVSVLGKIEEYQDLEKKLEESLEPKDKP